MSENEKYLLKTVNPNNLFQVHDPFNLQDALESTEADEENLFKRASEHIVKLESQLAMAQGELTDIVKVLNTEGIPTHSEPKAALQGVMVMARQNRNRRHALLGKVEQDYHTKRRIHELETALEASIQDLRIARGGKGIEQYVAALREETEK